MVDLYAIAIDDVRDIFGASPELAEELREAARTAFPPEKPRRRGFLPLIKPEVVDIHRPSADDLSVLLSGGFVPPERMVPSWRLFHALLDHRAADHQAVEIAPGELDAIEFDLSRNGLDSHYSLRRLAARELGIPLRGIDGGLIGYAKHTHVVETAEALRAVLPDVEPRTREVAEGFLVACDSAAADKDLDLIVLG